MALALGAAWLGGLSGEISNKDTSRRLEITAG